MPTEAELETAKENLRNSFFALAFDPDNRDTATQADGALRELDRLLDLAESAAVRSLAEPAGQPAAGAA
jgi:hypothetical protein